MNNQFEKDLFQTILFEGDTYSCHCVVHKENYNNYQNLLIELAKLKGQGILDFTYDSIYHPLILHCIYIEWFYNDDIIELDKSILIKILKLTENLTIDVKNNIWQLSSSIFIERK